jgi:hypothetical protein
LYEGNINNYATNFNRNNSNRARNKRNNINREVDVHIFRDVSQMQFDEEKGMWGDIDKSGVIIEVKNLSVEGVPDLTDLYQIRKFIPGQTTPLFTMVFKYQKRDKAGNYIYYCVTGNSKGIGELSKETKASITLQSSQNLSEMATGMSGYLTTIILDGGIFCYICGE